MKIVCIVCMHLLRANRPYIFRTYFFERRVFSLLREGSSSCSLSFAMTHSSLNRKKIVPGHSLTRTTTVYTSSKNSVKTHLDSLLHLVLHNRYFKPLMDGQSLLFMRQMERANDEGASKTI